MKLLSATGLHNEGWLEISASLSILSEHPLQLFFSLPKAVLFGETKRILLKHDGAEFTIVVGRDEIAATPMIEPINGVVSLEILASYAELSSGGERNPLGVRVVKIAELGKMPIDFIDFLRKSVASALPKLTPLPRVDDSAKAVRKKSPTSGFSIRSSSKDVVGQLERVSAELFVSGWAMTDKGESVTVQLWMSGILIASQVANGVRPDLIAAGLGVGNAGFRIKIPPYSLNSLINEVTVAVDGEPLNGSPKRLDLSPLIDLAVEEARHGKIFVRMRGWPGDQLIGRLFRDGLAVADVALCQRKRHDDSIELYHQGIWEIPAEMQDGQPHVYFFEIVAKSSIIRSDAVVLSYPEFLVHVDPVNQQSLQGWAFRKDRAAPLALNLFIDEVFVRVVHTSIARFDVDQIHERNGGTSGFEIHLDNAKFDVGGRVELRDVETGIVIVQISIADRYEALTQIATQLRRDGRSSDNLFGQSLISQIAIASNNLAQHSVSKLPKVRAVANGQGVDVVIPVYGGSFETAECIESVLKSINKTQSRVILVNDCSPDPLINDFLDALEKLGRDDLIIIRRKKNGGFSESVNIGMIIAGDRHVVLLNADTVVQNGWIDRLIAASDSDPMIGTVTPMSNNGEIVTLPYPCRSLAIDDSALARKVDQVAGECNSGMTIDIPVAIGFCMFIRRQCIDEVGLFDAALWGRGYGEEVDFCVKARALGWRHVVAADSFVVHRGNVSFGNEKLERIIESARKISERYPFYDQLIQRFLARDPIGPARRTINLALIAQTLGDDRILHITHSSGGGTEKYVRDLSRTQAKNGEVPLVIRFTADGQAELEVDLLGSDLAGLFDERHIEVYKKDELAYLKDDIKKLNIKRIHLHAPFGIPLDLLDWLTTEFPFNATIHDYAWICPRVSLTQGSGQYCGEPSVDQCDSCITNHKVHAGLLRAFEDSARSVALYRQNMRTFLGRAETLFAGAQDVADRLKKYGVESDFYIAPYTELEQTSLSPARQGARNGQVRVALFGAIGEIKGFHKLIACAKFAQEKSLPITFIVFGYTMDNAAAALYLNIVITGRYEEDELDTIVQEYTPDISFFPNQWPETYSYTLSHSLRLGLWPLVTELGAPAERVRAAGFGEIVSHDASEELLCERLLAAGLRRTQWGLKGA